MHHLLLNFIIKERRLMWRNYHMKNAIHFTRDYTMHAVLGVMPAFFLVCFGSITPGIAFAIGLLPTSLLGIASTRKLRLIYGILGCLFGVGVYIGSYIVNLHTIWEASIIFLVLSFFATVIAAKRPAGGLLLSLLIPSLAVGTSYSASQATGLAIAFMLGSIWSSFVSLAWSTFTPSKEARARLMALQPTHVRTYGLLLGLTASTSVIVGYFFDPAHAGWVATAAMLIIRPVQQMTGIRGIGRALSTIVGTILVVISIYLGLNQLVTALLISFVAILAIGARSSKWYITSFGTAFLILTIEMFGTNDYLMVHQIAWYRIIDNVIGAIIALIYGLFIPQVLSVYELKEINSNTSS
jgi:hypothetical protein